MATSDHLAVLPDRMIESLVETRAICSPEIEERQIQPASLDLRLGERAFRVRAGFLPGQNQTVMEALEKHHLNIHDFSLKNGAILEVGCVYVIELQEKLNLPEHISVRANPKSSTGRIDVLARLIGDNSGLFDRIDPGYRGPLYLEVTPCTFPIMVRSGSRLTQIRFLRPNDQARRGKTKSIHVNLQGISGGIASARTVIGYRARRFGSALDVDEKNKYEIEQFWEPIKPTKYLILDPFEFYILASDELVAIPGNRAAEMVPIDPDYGEFRVHYAGFFDPGFGDGETRKARAVLEVRSHQVPFVLRHGQAIGDLTFQPLAGQPRKLYGGSGSHYQNQGLKLSRVFRQESQNSG